MGEFLAVFGRDDLLNQLLVHVELSVAALLIGVVVAVPIALATFRSALWATVAINTGNIGRAVPSLAILALVFPLLGFGFAPSLVALTLLAIPPILINASTGLRQVNPQVIDAARHGALGRPDPEQHTAPHRSTRNLRGNPHLRSAGGSKRHSGHVCRGRRPGGPDSPRPPAQQPGGTDRRLPDRRRLGAHH